MYTAPAPPMQQPMAHARPDDARPMFMPPMQPMPTQAMQSMGMQAMQQAAMFQSMASGASNPSPGPVMVPIPVPVPFSMQKPAAPPSMQVPPGFKLVRIPEQVHA